MSAAGEYTIAIAHQTGRYIGTCETCKYSVIRAKRDSAVMVIAQHVAYQHGAEPREGQAA